MDTIDFRKDLFKLIDYFDSKFYDAFGELRFFIRNYRNILKEEEINILIDIFKDAIDNAKLKISENKWIEKNCYYFAGNSFLNEKWQEKFQNKSFTLLELKNYIEEIKYTKDYEFSLRVPEVTLRDDVEYEKDIICLLKKTYISILEDIRYVRLR
ncbi:MAG: hypothetical protein ACLUCH_08885 [Lachnospirales bacterium]